MIRSLWTGRSGMVAEMQSIDVLANNLANTNTIGFKSERPSFKSLLYQKVQGTMTHSDGTVKPGFAQVGLGARAAAITADFSQGAMLDSQNPHAFALDGKGFFAVQGADGQRYYTRNGDFSFAVDGATNTLTTSDGLRILSITGNPIRLAADMIPSQITYTSEGQLVYRTPEGEQNPLIYTDMLGNPIMYNDYRDNQDHPLPVQIGIYQFTNPVGLENREGTLFRATEASGAAINEFNNPDIIHTRVVNGYTEGSNVAVADEMVKMIVAQRAYESNSKVIQTTDTMMGDANELKR